VRVAVVGHLEWIEFVRGDHVPTAGEILHATDSFEEPAGGGAVAAVQLARMAGSATLITALGDDELGGRSRRRLAELGVEVDAVTRDEPTRRGLTILDSHGERTIITIGDRLAPRGGDPLDWGALEGADGVYFTAGDERALQAARTAKVLVATPRAGSVLTEAGVGLDALVYSAADLLESRLASAVQPRPALLVATSGAQGGSFESSDGRRATWAAAELPGPLMDAYGSGDTFAAALTYGLAAGEDVGSSLAAAAEAAASCLTRRGPYG
jgi:ribokinase